MSTLPFRPKNMGDIRTRYDALNKEIGLDPVTGEALTGDILDLILKAEKLLKFDPLGSSYTTEAISFLTRGDVRSALTKFKFALDSYLPN